MVRSLNVEMPCGFRGIKRKERKVKWHPYRLPVTVEIPEAPAFDDPQALTMSYERWAKFGPRRKETVTTSVAGHAGALWRPVPGPDGRPATFDDLTNAGPNTWGKYPFARRSAFGLPSHSEALLTMREIHENAAESVAERAVRIANDLLLVDGVLCRRDIEPVWMVRLGDKVEVDFQRPFPGRISSGIPFPITDRAGAETAAARLAESMTPKAKIKNSGMRLDAAADGFFSRTTSDSFVQMMAMALATARSTIRRGSRGQVPADLQERISEFTAAIAPGGNVCDAARLLDAVEIGAGEISGAYMGYYEGDDRGFGGGWLQHATAALSVGAVHDVVGGEGMRPEMDDEDEIALFSLGA